MLKFCCCRTFSRRRDCRVEAVRPGTWTTTATLLFAWEGDGGGAALVEKEGAEGAGGGVVGGQAYCEGDHAERDECDVDPGDDLRGADEAGAGEASA